MLTETKTKDKCPRCGSKKAPTPRCDGSKTCAWCGQRWRGNDVIPSWDKRKLYKEVKMDTQTNDVVETKTPKAKAPKEKKTPQNVEMSMEGTTIVLKIDPSKDLGKSKSGKTTLIGTTAGEFVYGGVCLNVNVYKK